MPAVTRGISGVTKSCQRSSAQDTGHLDVRPDKT